MNNVSKYVFTTSVALLLGGGMLQLSAEPLPYAGTATLCYVGAEAPSVEQKGEDGVSHVSGLVAVYYIQTA